MHAHLYTLARALHLAHTLNIHTDTCGRQSRAQSHSQRGRPAPFPAGARTPRPGWASESSNEPARANLPAVPLPETHQHARTYVQPCMHTHMNTRRTLRASALSWVHAQRLQGDVCGDGRHRRHTVAAACGAGAAGDPGGSASCHGIRTWCAACCFLLGDSRCAWAPARLRGDGDCADGQGAGEEAPHQRAGALCSCVRVVGRLPARASAHAGRAVGATGLSSRSGSRPRLAFREDSGFADTDRSLRVPRTHSARDQCASRPLRPGEGSPAPRPAKLDTNPRMQHPLRTRTRKLVAMHTGSGETQTGPSAQAAGPGCARGSWRAMTPAGAGSAPRSSFLPRRTFKQRSLDTGAVWCRDRGRGRAGRRRRRSRWG
jgi:hypothetical protein